MANILERPNFHPYVCIICGVGDNTRLWYVDLRLNLDNHFNPVMDGNVYLCNMCWEATVLEVQRLSQDFAGDFTEVPLTYENEEELLTEIKLEEEDGTDATDELGVFDSSSTELDSELTGDTELSEPATETVEPDSDDAPTKSLRNFTGFFGGKPGESD